MACVTLSHTNTILLVFMVHATLSHTCCQCFRLMRHCRTHIANIYGSRNIVAQLHTHCQCLWPMRHCCTYVAMYDSCTPCPCVATSHICCYLWSMSPIPHGTL